MAGTKKVLTPMKTAQYLKKGEKMEICTQETNCVDLDPCFEEFVEFIEAHGFELFAPITLTDGSRIGEIRILPDVQSPYLTEKSSKIHHSLYAHAWNDSKHIVPKFFIGGSAVYCAKKGDRSLESKSVLCKEQFQQVPNSEMDAEAGLAEGYVLRILYNSLEDCRIDYMCGMKFIENKLDFSDMSTYKFKINPNEDKLVCDEDLPF